MLASETKAKSFAEAASAVVLIVLDGLLHLDVIIRQNACGVGHPVLFYLNYPSKLRCEIHIKHQTT